jgi:NCAIR mutase (PurE)-related protein
MHSPLEILEAETREEENTDMETMKILQAVQAGTMTPQEAKCKLKIQPFEGDIGFAKIDHHRALRQGAQEVIYGAAKTADQILKIAQAMDAHGDKNILITRMKPEAAELVGKSLDLFYDPLSKVGIVNREFKDTGDGYIAVVSGGTGDQPLSEEAALTAEALGNRVERIYDVGVAGLYRLLAKLDVIMGARVIIAVAGMEGALPSVVGGLVDAPVIAVPTSVGYGASLGGISALLNMLNSCASGVSVVNIDNGFGAGFLAGRINHMEGSK